MTTSFFFFLVLVAAAGSDFLSGVTAAVGGAWGADALGAATAEALADVDASADAAVSTTAGGVVVSADAAAVFFFLTGAASSVGGSDLERTKPTPTPPSVRTPAMAAGTTHRGRPPAGVTVAAIAPPVV